MAEQNNHLHVLRAFASLRWYEETIKFVFPFVAKTSELLLAAGIVISTANFLTDGAVMSHNTILSDAWSWAQALAIDSSLGIVFMNAFQSLREHDRVKAGIFFPLTALLATVAGLITHFDALGHATGLSVTDARISGIIPVWVMTALRAVAVIGFLLASRLKEVSFQHLRQQWSQEALPSHEPCQQQAISQIDSQALASALVGAMQQAGVVGNVSIVEEKITSLPSPAAETKDEMRGEQADALVPVLSPCSDGHTQREEPIIDEPAEVKIARAYEALAAERVARQERKPISARDLAQRAKVRRSTCSAWLQHQGAFRLDASGCQNEGEPCVARKEGRMSSSFPRPNTLSEEATHGLDP
jgi:hypothetical protein